MTPEAKQKMFLDNRWLVNHIAGRYKCPEQDREDMLQEGYLALWRAIDSESFDPKKGTFATFAGKCIERQMGDFVSEAFNNSGLSAGADTLKRVGRAAAKSKSKVGEINPSIWLEETGYDRQTSSTNAWRLTIERASLDAPINIHDSDDDATLLNFYGATEDDYDFMTVNNAALLRAFINLLPEHEKEAICLNYGIGCEQMTMREIARIKGRSQTAILHRVNSAKKHLREMMEGVIDASDI